MLRCLLGISFLLVGCTTSRVSLESPFTHLRTTAREDVILKSVGPPGQTFHAVLNIDGRRQELSATSPVEFPLDVCWMTAEIHKTGGPGSLSFKVVAPRRAVGCCGMVKVGSSCWFAYHDGELRSQ